MPSILGANTLSGGYEVANSARFNNDASSDSFSRDMVTATSRRKFTISMWVKKTNNAPGSEQVLFHGWQDSNNRFQIGFQSDNTLQIRNRAGGSDNVNYTTTQRFRDTSAWYHLVFQIDTTHGNANFRIRLYVNGTQVTQFDTSTSPDQNADMSLGTSDFDNIIGIYGGGGNGFSGYMTEVVYLDGLDHAASFFGEFDEDSPAIWKPKDVSDFTFGNNGFYLDFEDSSNLGLDVSGESHSFTVNNLTAIDQTTDTCTNNFAIMNTSDNGAAGSAFSEGNLKIVTTNGNITYNTSTIGFDTGKWYMETKLAGSAGYTVGVVRGVATANDNGNKLGNRADGFSYDDGGIVENNGGTVSGSFASYSSGDVIGVYADLDNNKLYFSKDGSLQNSGTGLDLTAGTYFFAVGDNNASNSSTYEVNFGNPVSALSSAVSDGTYGSFEYSTTITGDGASKTFKALNTKNLAEFG